MRVAMVVGVMTWIFIMGAIVGQQYERHHPQTVIERTVYKVSDEERAAAEELVTWLRSGRLVCANGPIIVPAYTSMDNLHVLIVPHVPLQSIIEMHSAYLSRTYVYEVGGANPYLWMGAVALARNYVERYPPDWQELFSVVRADGDWNTVETLDLDETGPHAGGYIKTLVQGE